MRSLGLSIVACTAASPAWKTLKFLIRHVFHIWLRKTHAQHSGSFFLISVWVVERETVLKTKSSVTFSERSKGLLSLAQTSKSSNDNRRMTGGKVAESATRGCLSLKGALMVLVADATLLKISRPAALRRAAAQEQARIGKRKSWKFRRAKGFVEKRIPVC